MTIKELIEILREYPQDKEIVVRRAFEKGYFADYTLNIGVFFPDDTIAVMAGHPVENTDISV